MRLLITGATGKVGQNFLPRFLADERFADWQVVALCNNRLLDDHDRIDCIRGSLSDRQTISRAMQDVTHILHMAAVKESPDLVIDVAIKGLFGLLEEMRQSPDARQFILIGGDCSVGHIFHHYDGPVTETSPRRAYQGCYALTKVLEEEMLEQYQIQYDLNGCCLRAPWIMEKDDFRFVLKFGDEQFGGPPWSQLISGDDERRFMEENRVPLLTDRDGAPLLRNFVHVSDLVEAILCALDAPAARQQLFNIAMNRPVNYAEAAALLQEKQGMRAADIKTPYFSNWLDNSKARQLLRWEPEIDLDRMIDDAWAYQRPQNEPRKIWYPG